MNKGACTKEGTCTKEGNRTKEGTHANQESCTNDVLVSNVKGVRALMPVCWNNVHPLALGYCIMRLMGGWSSLSSMMLFVLLVVMVVLPLVLLL
jgi:hypothetical protein